MTLTSSCSCGPLCLVLSVALSTTLRMVWLCSLSLFYPLNPKWLCRLRLRDRFFCTHANEHFHNLPIYLFMTEENQNVCMRVFPLVKTWLQEVALPRAELAQPICSFIGMTVANNCKHISTK